MSLLFSSWESNRVDRGGGWDYGLRIAQVTIRDYHSPDVRNGDLGMRLIRRFL